MKILGKRIQKGSLLLLLSFAAISACCITITGTIKAGRENELQSRRFYTEKARKFQIENCEVKDLWEEFLNEAEGNHFALYTTIWDEMMDVRGYYGRGKTEEPPILRGRFFDSRDQFGGTHLVVLGKAYEGQIKKEGNEEFWEYRGISYKVIGIMGTREDSRINRSVYLDFASGIDINSVNTRYIIDGRQIKGLNQILQDLEQYMVGKGNINITVSDMKVGIDRLFSEQRITNFLYGLILISFLLSSVIVTALWLSYRGNEISIKRMMGLWKREIVFDICREYGKIALAGYVCSLPFILWMQVKNQALRITYGDMLLSFCLTVVFGFLALCAPLYQEMKTVISERMR